MKMRSSWASSSMLVLATPVQRLSAFVSPLVPTQDGCHGARNERGRTLFGMTTESVSTPPTSVKLSTECLPMETLERSKTGNKFEKIKCAKPGDTMWTEVHELAAGIRSGKFTWEELGLDDADIRLKWAGLFHRRKTFPGTFMMRLKVPNGVLNTAQLRYVADAVRKYDPAVGVLDVTTRMNLQLRGVTLEDSSDVIKELYDLGLCTLMSGMDNVRNMVGSPIAGIDPLEMIDTRQLCDEVNDMVTDFRRGNPELTNLPRKLNIAISGGRDDFAHTMINDVGLQPHVNPGTGEVGFNVVVGGFFSIKRVAESVPLDMWLRPCDVTDFCHGVLLAFRDLGSRKNRQKARLMYMIEEIGLDAFRETVVEYTRRLNPGFDPLPAMSKPTEPYDRRDPTGIHAQKQEGKSWVCVGLNPVGRLTAEQAHLAADVADAYCGGELRLTVDQKVLFPNVDDALVPEMLKMPFFEANPLEQGELASRVVSCTGAQYCGLALIETKYRAMRIASKLEDMLVFPEGSRPPRIHWTGCPNSCGQAQMGDIGLMGGPARLEGKAVEGVNIFLGGGLGETHALGEIAKKGIPAAEEFLLPVLRDICIEQFGAILKPGAVE